MHRTLTVRRSLALLVVAVVAVLASFAGATLAGGGQTFSDVPPGHPFHDEIEWLADSGITTGYADGTFRPGQPVSRQAMAAYLQRLHAGISTYTVEEHSSEARVVWGATVDCPPDQRAIAGGGFIDRTGAYVAHSKPTTGNAGWNVRWESDDGASISDVTATAYVTCIPATPVG